jgi:hypothetical protein
VGDVEAALLDGGDIGGQEQAREAADGVLDQDEYHEPTIVTLGGTAAGLSRNHAPFGMNDLSDERPEVPRPETWLQPKSGGGDVGVPGAPDSRIPACQGGE